jgi:hypothetical protein
VAAEDADGDGKGRARKQQKDAVLTGRMLLFPVEDVLCSLYPAIAYACQQGLRSRRDAVSMFLAVPQRDRDKPHAFEHIGQFGASPLLFGGGGGLGGAQSHHSGPPRSVRLSAGAGSQHSSRSGHSSARSAGDGNAHGNKPSSLKGGAAAATGTGTTAALSATGGVSRAPSAAGSVTGSMAGTSRRGGNMASSTHGAGGRVMTAGGSTIGADGVRVLAMTEANLNPQAAQAAAAAQVQCRAVPKKEFDNEHHPIANHCSESLCFRQKNRSGQVSTV